jgi:hypothetical protein
LPFLIPHDDRPLRNAIAGAPQFDSILEPIRALLGQPSRLKSIASATISGGAKQPEIAAFRWEKKPCSNELRKIAAQRGESKKGKRRGNEIELVARLHLRTDEIDQPFGAAIPQ